MSILDGLAEEALEDFAEDFEDGFLTPPAGRTSNGQGGWVITKGDPLPCKVLITNPSDYRRLTLGIPATDRIALVLGASVTVVPVKGHKVTAPDPLKGMAMTDFDVVAVSSDPAGALFKLQVH